jgi:hypothetical protein
LCFNGQEQTNGFAIANTAGKTFSLSNINFTPKRASSCAAQLTRPIDCAAQAVNKITSSITSINALLRGEREQRVSANGSARSQLD